MDDFPAAAIRFALYVSLTGLFGLAAFAQLALAPSERHRAFEFPPQRVLLLLVAGSIIFSVLSLLAVTSEMSGTPMADLDVPTLKTVLLETPLGASWTARIVALVAALGCTIAGRPLWSGILISSGVALASLAWAGHGAMNQGSEGWLHLGADVIHLIAAAGWLGSLAGFLLLLAASRAAPDLLRVAHRALKGFAATGTGLVAVIILSGLINAWFTVGIARVGTLLSSTYGILLLAKIALVMTMLALASLNRFRFTPALGRSFNIGNPDEARGALWISVLAEALLGVAALGVVAWLGLLEPLNSGM